MPVIQLKKPENVIQITGLQYIRLKKGISIKALSKKIGRDEKLIRLLENQRIASYKTLYAISQELSISIQEITKNIEIEKVKIEKMQKKILSSIRSESANQQKLEKIHKNYSNLDIKIKKILSCRWSSGLILNN